MSDREKSSIRQGILEKDKHDKHLNILKNLLR